MERQKDDTGGPRAAGSAPRPQVDATPSVEAWRGFMLDRVAFWLWVVIGAALLLVSLREGVSNQRWAVSYALAPSWALSTVAAFRRSLSTRVRALCVVAAMAGGCLVLIAQSAFHVPNPFVALSSLVVLLSLFTGTRTALWVLGALLAGVAAAGAMHAQGIAIVEAAMFEANTPGNWLRVILVFAGITTATVACVGYVTTRLETALNESQAVGEGGSAATVRPDLRSRHRRGHPRGPPGTRLRPVLHHQGHRRRYRAGPERGARHRHPGWWLRRARLRA